MPQLFADVDRDKVLKQGVALGDVYQTMQTFLGGLFVNQFTRFGRQWRVFLEAEGAKLRLRPILMTSFAFILGCVPLWVATGSGAASRRIPGTVVVTGMLAATALAIFIIPLLFVLTERLASRFTRQAHASGPAPAPLEGEA